jgi:hypothetical protein
MNLSEFFKELNYTLKEDSREYLDKLDEVRLKLLVKRIYETNDFIKNELNKQVKLTQYKSLQDVVQNLDRNQTVEFVNWMAENIFGTKQLIEEELEKILIKG